MRRSTRGQLLAAAALVAAAGVGTLVAPYVHAGPAEGVGAASTSPSASTSAPSASSAPSAAAVSTALQDLRTLPVSDAYVPGYDRALFGRAWADVDHNGCDTRNDVLRRDFVDVVTKPGTRGCVVLSGTLHDPYTGRTIAFTRGETSSLAVQIDHRYTLALAWQHGASSWTPEQREAFANDQATNLVAVDGRAKRGQIRLRARRVDATERRRRLRVRDVVRGGSHEVAAIGRDRRRTRIGPHPHRVPGAKEQVMKTTSPDPIQAAFQDLHWSAWGTPVLIAVVALIVVGVIVAGILFRAQYPVDRMQKHLRAGNSLAPVLYPRRRKDAKQLHPYAENLPVGQRIGTLVGASSTWVWQGWRDVAVYIFGTGRGKTSALVVRHMLEAVGAAVMTTNKVDGVKEVLAGRKRAGEQWVYDPTQVYRHDKRPDFVYDPLTAIEDLVDAQELAAIFEASTKDADSKKDAQFDSQGLDLFAYALLAAKLEGESLRKVYDWVIHQNHMELSELLERHGQTGPSMALEGLQSQPDKTRGSVYATAQRMASALANDKLLAWTSAPGVRKFDPEAFVRSNDTAILISRNGPGSGSAFVAALVRAIAKAGERAAAADGGRIEVPVVFELDEAANVVRWPELPDLVSFYGSLGLILGIYFQGWDQMVRVFGAAGAGALWTTSPIRVYGGGESTQSAFLEKFSKGVGPYDKWTTNYSSGRNGSSRSRTSHSVPILPADELAHLPEWRAVLDPAAAKPVLIETRPWFRDKVLTAMVNGQEVVGGKIVKQPKATAAAQQSGAASVDAV